MRFIDEYRALVDLLKKGKKSKKDKAGDLEKVKKSASNYIEVEKHEDPFEQLQQSIVYYLNVIKRFCGMFYYLFDNLVWMANMGAIYK